MHSCCWARWAACDRPSVPSGFPASHAASMTSHHAQPEPDQRSDERRREGEQPKRPCEAPEQESQGDRLAILDHEDGQQYDSAERGHRSAAEPTPFFRATISAGARRLGTTGAGAWCLLGHYPSPCAYEVCPVGEAEGAGAAAAAACSAAKARASALAV